MGKIIIIVLIVYNMSDNIMYDEKLRTRWKQFNINTDGVFERGFHIL